MQSLSTPRRLLASLGGLGGAICMRSWGGTLPRALWLPTLLLVGSAGLVWSRNVGAQLLVRAAWWSNLILGTIIALAGNRNESQLAALLALATGGALLAVGERALHAPERSGAFVPLAFRGTLVCLLVMSMADAQSLLLFGSIDFAEHRGALPLAIGAALLLSVVGLYRLRLWGLLLGLAATLALALLALTNAFELPMPLRVAYAASAVAQWIASLPIVVAIVRRRAPVARPSLRARGYVTAGVISLMVLGSLACGFVLRATVLPWR